MKQNSGHPWHTAKKNRYRNLFLKILSGALAFILAAPLCSPEHTADCGYQPAAESSPCAHEHSEGCEFIEGTEGSCAHIHDENCGFAEAAAEIPCAFACDICDAKLMGTEEDAGAADKTPAPMAVASWSWESDYLEWNEEGGFWGLGMPGAGEEGNVTPAMLAEEYLPAEILAVLADGAEETLALQWDFGGLPEEGAAAGSYQLTAALPEGYTLGETAQEIQVQLELGGGETLVKYQALALNEWTWEGFDKGKDAVLALNVDEIDTAEQLFAALEKMLPKRIYGSTMGLTKTEDDGPYEFDRLDENASPQRTWGYLKVDWSELKNQINEGIRDGRIELGTEKDFIIEAKKPTYENVKYFINAVWDAEPCETMQITIRPVSFEAHTVAPANPANVTVNLFDYWAKTKEPTEASNGDILPKNDNHFHEEGGEGALGNTPTKYSTKDDWNVGINKGHLLLFGDGMIHAGLWNKGAGENCRYGKQYAGMEGIVKNILPENGYPELNLPMAKETLTGKKEGEDGYRDYTLIKDYNLTGDHDDSAGNRYTSTDIQNLSNTVIGTWGGNIETDTESLDYLFDPMVKHENKTSYQNVTGLFQLDEQGISKRRSNRRRREVGQRRQIYPLRRPRDHPHRPQHQP